MLHVKSLVLASALLALASCGASPTRAVSDEGLNPNLEAASAIEDWALQCSVRIAECEGDIYTTTDGGIGRVDADNLSETAAMLYSLVGTGTTERITGVFDLSLGWDQEYGQASRAYYAMN